MTATEDTPHRGWFLSDYERSKYDAERAAVREAERHAVELVCVNPASVQGPGRTGGTARLILDYANGRLRTLVRSRFSLVDVDDCSEGHLLAEARGRPGRRYLLAGVCVTTDEAIATLARITGIERRTLTLPRPVALAAADAGGGRGPRARTPAEAVPRDGRDAAPRPRLRRLAGRARSSACEYRSFDDMVRRTLAWYVDQGMVSASRAGSRAGRAPSAPPSTRLTRVAACSIVLNVVRHCRTLAQEYFDNADGSARERGDPDREATTQPHRRRGLRGRCAMPDPPRPRHARVRARACPAPAPRSGGAAPP